MNKSVLFRCPKIVAPEGSLRLFALAVILLTSCFHAARAQNNNITLVGKVYDSRTGAALPGATIHIKGTTHEVVSDEHGEFKFLTGQKPPLSLSITYIGYESKEEAVNDAGYISIRLRETNSQLNDVVVVGYGAQSRRNLVGSVVKVDPAQTKDIPGGGFDAQLQGKTAGVQINSNTGVPGQDVFIRVRGATSIYASNDPLYIVDGVFVNTASLQQIYQSRTTSPMADIDPADIESVEILKDASAVAIYGSRGANGVVIVTTKRGKYDQRPQINFSTTQGASWVPLERQWKTTTGPQHAMLINEYNTNMGKPLPFRPVDSLIAGVAGRGTPAQQNTYDRMKYLDHQGAPLHNYNLSVHGGSKDTKYYLGAGYDYEAADWHPISFSRASLKINIDQRLNKYITLTTSNTLSAVKRNVGFAANGALGTLLEASLNIPTYLPVFSSAGVPLKWVNFDNITYLTNTVNQKSTSLHYIGNAALDVALQHGLSFRSSFGIDYDNYNESQHWGSGTLIGAAPTNGYASTSITQSSTFVNEQTLNYTGSVGRHNFGILLGNTIESNQLQSATVTGSNFPNDSYTLVSQAASQTAGQTWTKSTLTSFFSRVNYSYAGRYMLEATIRADGSSRFAAGHQWGYFPSIGGAWNIREEKFMSDNNLFSNLKLRVSYGAAGNQTGISDFASRGLWTAGYGYADTTGGASQPGTAPYQLSNPGLTWEKTTQKNIGIDAGLLKNRVNIEINYYYKYTSDVLLQVPVPATTGLGSAPYYANDGAISNRGYELSISSLNISNKNFSWKTEFNAARNDNRIEKLATPINNFDASRNLLQDQQGSSLYSYWLYKQLYVDPQTGTAIFQHADKSTGSAYTTKTADRQLFNIWPKLFGGLTNAFTYKGLDLNVFFTYEYGNKIWNHNRMLGETGGTLDANRVLLASQLERWTTPGQKTDVPKLNAENYSIQPSSRFLEDGSFIRLRSLALGYSIPKGLLSKINIQAVRLSLTATNLFLVTKYKGADPETNLGGSQNLQGYDYALPPMPRSFLLGLNLTF